MQKEPFMDAESMKNLPLLSMVIGLLIVSNNCMGFAADETTAENHGDRPVKPKKESWSPPPPTKPIFGKKMPSGKILGWQLDSTMTITQKWGQKPAAHDTICSFMVDKSGRAVHIKVLKGSGSKIVDKEALKLLRECTFKKPPLELTKRQKLILTLGKPCSLDLELAEQPSQSP